MQLFHLYHNHKFEDIIHSDFWLFELSIWLHVLARSLITVFVPILLLTTGYSLTTVLVYYLIYNACDVPLNWFARFLTRAIGARRTMIFATIAVIAFFLTLGILTPDNWMLLIVLALFASLYDSAYWVSHIYLFMVASRGEQNTAKNTSWIYIVKRFAGLLGPAIGAGILLFADKEILIAVSVALFILSLIPLFRAAHIEDKPDAPSLPFKLFFKESADKKNYLSRMLYSVHGSVEGVLWPLFIFILFGSIESVALVPIIVSLTSMIFSYFAGTIHKSNRDKTIMIGSALIAVVWVLRLSIDATAWYYITIFLVGIFSLLVTIPIDADTFERHKDLDPLSAAMYRNASSMSTKIVLYGILLLFVEVFKVSFVVAIVSLFVLLMVNYIFIRVLNRPQELSPQI